MKATSKANVNIALIKYWGKRNEQLILPTNNSLSLTLDGLYTTTTVHFKEDLKEDIFYLDGERVLGMAYERVTQFLDIIRKEANKEHLFAEITSKNDVPTAAGFRSEEHTSELQSRGHLVCRLLLEKKKKIKIIQQPP